MQRAELHFHLLPGVDDGPADLDEAVALGRAAVADGTGLVTVTPHVRDLLRQEILGALEARVGAVQEALDAAGVALAVHPGGELAHDEVLEMADEELDAIAHGPAGRRWVLIEAPLFGDLEGFLVATAQLRARRVGTLIGHPERCEELVARPAALAAERAAGALLQVNASSLTGRHGEGPRRAGLELVRSGQATVIASDAHGPSRPPQLSAALDTLVAAGLPRAAVEPLAAAAPRALLEHGIAPGGARRAA